MLSKVLAAFGIQHEGKVDAFGSGLINHTWRVAHEGKDYILQRINHHVFRKPWNIADNIRHIGEYLSEHHPGYLFTTPAKTILGEDLYYNEEEGYFRLFPFIEGSHTIDVAQTPGQAYTAAREFGKFTRLLEGFPADTLKITIPDFHNITLRYDQFLLALKEGDAARIAEARDTIRVALSHEAIVQEFGHIAGNPDFKTRVIHHDTKISNVLLSDQEEGLCVIDLDTVMPGYFISDLGDMMRTYLSPVSEEEADFGKIAVREDFFKAIVEGYSDQMKDQLTGIEKKHFLYAGQFMVYMQAIRFLTDFLNRDVYYGSKYPGHNLVRANNQLALLAQFPGLRHLA